MTFILLSSVSTLSGSVLMKASSNPTLHRVHKRDFSLPFDGWVASFTNHLNKEGDSVEKEEKVEKVEKEGKVEKEEKEENVENVEKEGRWIELTPVSSPLAATKEQMLTLGLKIVSLPTRAMLMSPS